MEWLTTNLYPRGLEKTAIFMLLKQNGMVSIQNLKNSFHCFWCSECEDLSQVWMEKISKGVSTLDFETGKNDEFSLK